MLKVIFKKASLIVFPILIISISLFSQSNPYGQVSISSPTAASLGKYADIPVSYHTGIPQISIPLYTVTNGSLELPIGLSYHASGLKVMETASWVGAGWSLNAGGMITRTVMSLPDEKGTTSGAVSTHGYFSDYGYNNYLSGAGIYQDWVGFAEGRKDGEPDLFFFNFGGYTGKFFFRDDRTPILVPQQDIKIIPHYPGTGSIQGFTVVTPDGVKYFFGNTPGFSGTMPYEITNPYSQEGGYVSGTAISSWYLHKIVSADDQFSINLSYTSENYSYFTVGAVPVDNNPTGGFLPTKEYNVIKNIVQGVRLSQISFPNGTVSFNAGAVRTDLSDYTLTTQDNVNQIATSLGSIQITNSNGFCKKYTFFQDYFIDNTTAIPTPLTTAGYSLQTDRKRLRLDSIRESTCDQTITLPSHQFSYFAEAVPRRINFGMDHWGFINAVTSNQTLIPTYTTNNGTTITTFSGANRSSAWPAMRGGTLKQITYPTGGTTEFSFETADQYSSSTTTQENVTILNGMSVHLFGQNTEFSKTQPFTCNNNPIIFSGTNTTLNFAPFSIKNSSNTVVASGNFTNGVTQTFTLNLSAGNYTVTINVDGNTANGLGIQANMIQLGDVTNTVTNTVGGLRIQSITTKETTTTTNPIVKSYTYPNGGFLYSVPTYVQHIRNDLVQTLGFYNLTNGYETNSFIASGCPVSGGGFLKSGGSLRPMATTQGYHIGYPFVRVKQTGNGYSDYHYYTSNSGYSSGSLDLSVVSINTNLLACASTTPNHPAAPLPFDYKKGELYYEQHYTEDNNLLKNIEYYPEYDLSPQQPTPGFVVSARANGGGGVLLLGTFYTLSSPRRIKMRTVETHYTPGVGSNIVTTTTYMSSPFHQQVTRTVKNTSTTDSLITLTKYNPDFRLSACDAITNCVTPYNNDCNTCLAQYNTARNNCNNNGLCIANAFQIYQNCLSVARNTYVSCRKTNYMDTGNTFDDCRENAKNSASTELKPILELQLEHKVVPLEVTEWRNNKLMGASFTRFDYVTDPIGKVYPNKVQQIKLSVPSTSFTAATVSGSTLVKDSRYTDEMTLLFKGGNVVEVISKSGVPTAYIWGYNNTLPVVKAEGVSHATLLSAYNAVGGNLAVLRSQPYLNGAFVKTYIYTPLVGITTEADARDRKLFYEYDALGRLSLVRDHDGKLLKKFEYQYQANTNQ